MAARTQLRLDQITGSFINAEGGIVDTLAVDNGASLQAITLHSGSMVGVLSEVVSSIKRLHGADTFAKNATGEISQAVTVKAAGGLTLGAGGDEFSITESSDDVTIKTLISNKDMIFNVNDGGVDTEVFRLDGDVAAVKLASGKQIQFGGAGENISGDGTDMAINSSNDIDIVAANKLTIDAQGTTADDGVEITLGDDTAGTKFVVLNNSGNPVIVADGLQDVSVGRNLTVAGDFTVNGTTTTLDVTNLNVQDPFILLGDGLNSLNSNTGLIFVSGSSKTARPDVSFGRVANDVWALGSIASHSGSITTAAGATIDISLRANGLQIVDATNKIALDGSSNLTLTSAASTVIDAAGDIVLDAQGNDLEFKSAGTSIFKVTNSSSDVVLQPQVANKDIIFKEDGGNEIARFDSSAESLALSSTKKLTFNNDATSINSSAANRLDIKANFVGVTGSYLEVGNGTDGVGSLRLMEDGDNGINHIALSAPAALGSDITLTLPSSLPGSAGQALVGDTGGALSFASVITNESFTKANFVVAQQVTSGTAFDSNSAHVSTTAPSARAELDLQTITGTTQGNQLDVFVNGQLLLSGADADVGAGNADYLFAPISDASKIKFGFNLEEGDVVSLRVFGD